MIMWKDILILVLHYFITLPVYSHLSSAGVHYAPPFFNYTGMLLSCLIAQRTFLTYSVDDTHNNSVEGT